MTPKETELTNLLHDQINMAVLASKTVKIDSFVCVRSPVKIDHIAVKQALIARGINITHSELANVEHEPIPDLPGYHWLVLMRFTSAAAAHKPIFLPTTK